MNIMISANSAYLKPAKVMLYSLFAHHNKEEMDIYMPYANLEEGEVRELADFVGMFPGKKLYPLLIDKDFSEKVESHNGISIETYYRILAIDILPENLDRILYLDVDMIIQGSLTELYETEVDGYPFAVCEDILGILNDFHEMNKYRMRIPKEYSYFNAGVMLFNLPYLRQTGAAGEILNRIYENYERYEYNDQDVLNEMYYDRLRWVKWDKYNLPPALYYIDKAALAENQIRFASYEEMKLAAKDPEEFAERYQDISASMRREAKIIHYMGAAKPWNRSRNEAAVYRLFDEPYLYYEFLTENRSGSEGAYFHSHKGEIVRKMLSVGYSYYFLKQRLEKALAGKKQPVNVWVLGSSYAAQGVLDAAFPWLTNLAAPSQDLFCSKGLLDKSICRNSEEESKVCILMLGYYALYDDLSGAGKETSDLMLTVYAPLIGETHHKEGKAFHIREELQNSIPCMDDGRIVECEDWIRQFFAGENYFNSLYTREGNDPDYTGEWQTLSREEKEKIGKTRAEKHNRLRKHQDVREENVGILRDILEELQRNEIPAVVMIPPFTEYYRRYLAPEYQKELLEALDSFSSPVIYYDLNELGEFGDADFFDSDHLNDTGAAKLTELICRLLEG